jgi:uncharacterized membrane protein
MLNTIINIVHILSTAVWIGGAFFIHFVLQPSLNQIDTQQSGKLMGIISKRFSITAWICLVLLIITGYLKTPHALLFNITTDVGLYLAIKHLLIILVVVSGLVIGLYVVPNLRKSAPTTGEVPSATFIQYQKKLSNLATFNLVLGILIVVFASLLW